jgi:hypothetical protein
MKSVLLLLMLCLCGGASARAEGQEPDKDLPSIEIFLGGTFHGSTMVTVYADDSYSKVVRTQFDEKPPVITEGTLRSGTYEAMYDTVRRRLPYLLRYNRSGVKCFDYGTDSVTIVPPINGRSGVSVICPVPAVTSFIEDLQALMESP